MLSLDHTDGTAIPPNFSAGRLEYSTKTTVSIFQIVEMRADTTVTQLQMSHSGIDAVARSQHLTNGYASQFTHTTSMALILPAVACLYLLACNASYGVKRLCCYRPQPDCVPKSRFVGLWSDVCCR